MPSDRSLAEVTEIIENTDPPFWRRYSKLLEVVVSEVATALDAARAEEREDVLLYVRQLAKNHPHLFEPYEHLAKNLEIGAHALRARGRP